MLRENEWEREIDRFSLGFLLSGALTFCDWRSLLHRRRHCHLRLVESCCADLPPRSKERKRKREREERVRRDGNNILQQWVILPSDFAINLDISSAHICRTFLAEFRVRVKIDAHRLQSGRSERKKEGGGGEGTHRNKTRNSCQCLALRK